MLKCKFIKWFRELLSISGFRGRPVYAADVSDVKPAGSLPATDFGHARSQYDLAQSLGRRIKLKRLEFASAAA